jgi:hypothetical protein
MLTDFLVNERDYTIKTAEVAGVRIVEVKSNQGRTSFIFQYIRQFPWNLAR